MMAKIPKCKVEKYNDHARISKKHQMKKQIWAKIDTFNKFKIQIEHNVYKTKKIKKKHDKTKERKGGKSPTN